MTGRKREPPALAIRLLQYCTPSDQREAVLGDILEKFQGGSSSRWIWREVILLILWRFGAALRIRAGEIIFALVGTAVAELWWRSPWARTLWQSSTMQSLFGWGVGWHFPFSTIYDVTFDSITALLTTLLPLVVFWSVTRSWCWVCTRSIILIGFFVSIAGQFAIFLLPRQVYLLSPVSFFLALLICALISRKRRASNEPVSI